MLVRILSSCDLKQLKQRGAGSQVGGATDLTSSRLNGLFLFIKVGEGPDAESGLAALLSEVFGGQQLTEPQLGAGAEL